MEDLHTGNVALQQDSISVKYDNIPKKKRKGRKGNKNKRKGTSFEHRVAAYYTKRGYEVLRARGSLGPADLICLRQGERDIFVQCKDINSNYFSKLEMQQFASYCKRHSRRCVWAYNYHHPEKKRGKMKFINLETTPVEYITKAFIAKPQQNYIIR